MKNVLRSTFESGYIGLLQLVLSGVMMHLVDVVALMKQKHNQNKNTNKTNTKIKANT